MDLIRGALTRQNGVAVVDPYSLQGSRFQLLRIAFVLGCERQQSCSSTCWRWFVRKRTKSPTFLPSFLPYTLSSAS